MTTARALIAPPGVTNTFHCISRCVRRSWLCGKDPYDGRDYEHRRSWIQARILELADIFAVGIHGYAVMSNHVHLVIHVDPALTHKWTDIELAERGVALHCPGKFTEALRLARISAWRDNPEKLAELRVKLGSLSSFMQALNQPIARAANIEDDCTGKFWEGRYKCQLLKDESAVASAMVYVDLNPVRAGMATDLDSSDHTSVQQRILRIKKNKRAAAFTLRPIAGLCDQSLLNMTEAAYIKLVDWTGKRMHPDKFGKISGETPSVLRETEGSGAGTPAVLREMGLSERRWQGQIRGTENIYWRAIGSADSLMELAEDLGQKWLRGIRAVTALERPG